MARRGQARGLDHQSLRRHVVGRPDLEGAAGSRERPSDPAVRPRARNAGRRRLHGVGRRFDPCAVGSSGRFPLRRLGREPEAAPRRLRGSGSDRLRHRGCREPLLHLHLDDAARDGGVRVLAAALRRLRPAQPHRRRRGGRAAVDGLPHVRGAPPDPRAPRDDGRRARAPVRRGAKAGSGPGRLRGRWLGARHALRGDRPAVGTAFAEHADARHRARLSGHVPARGHQFVRRARHHAAVRALRRSLARRPRSGRCVERAGDARSLVPVRAVSSDVRQACGQDLRGRVPAGHRHRVVPSVSDGFENPRDGSPPGAPRIRLADRNPTNSTSVRRSIS